MGRGEGGGVGGPRIATPGVGNLGWAIVPAAIALISRAVSIAIIGIESILAGVSPAAQLTAWDGQWYLRIAADGYHAELIRNGYDFAFFPAWPLVIRVGTLGFIPPAVSAVVLANVLFILGAIVTWRLLATRLDDRTATVAVALLACSPAAYVFSLAYSESLFLLVAAACLLVARPARKGGLAAVASITRLAGLAIPAAMLGVYALDLVRGGRGPVRPLAFVVIGGLVGFLAWAGFIAVLTGDPFGYLIGSAAWFRHGPVPLVIQELQGHPLRVLAWFAFYAAVAIGSIVLFRRDRLLGLYAAIALVLPLALVAGGGYAHSIARYALAAFPAFAGLALVAGRRGSAVLAVAFVSAQVVFAWWTITAGGAAP